MSAEKGDPCRPLRCSSTKGQTTVGTVPKRMNQLGMEQREAIGQQ
jgi:hypothetical protein